MDTTTTIQPPRIYKRRLATHHASRCGLAHCKVCKCRCKGQLHGLDHMVYKTIEDKLFADKKALKMDVYQTDIDNAVQQAINLIRGLKNGNLIS